MFNAFKAIKQASLWSQSFPKIAVNTYMGMNKIVQPNVVIDLGILHPNIGTLPQLTMLLPVSPVVNANNPDTSYANESGHGEVYVPNTNDYYMGEG
jgi:hypothetical protein